MVGTADQVASPSGIVAAFGSMATPKRLVTLHNFGFDQSQAGLTGLRSAFPKTVARNVFVPISTS